ncbi:hypothetical protein Trydic_g18506 [Trypoxylus dichotomus]
MEFRPIIPHPSPTIPPLTPSRPDACTLQAAASGDEKGVATAAVTSSIDAAATLIRRQTSLSTVSRSYWKDVLLNYLCKTADTQLSVKDISQEMAIHSYDIVSTLQALGMMKYWKGKHIILRKKDVLDEYVERVKRRGPLLKEVDPTCLRWTPFVPPQSNPS